MAPSNDSKIAHLAQMVANLAVQVASLSPAVNNANIGRPAQPHATQPPTANQASTATVPPVSNVATAGPASAESSDDPGVADDLQPCSSSAHRRWYVVIVSTQVGVFHGWTNAAPLVLGVAGSIYN